MKIISNTQNFKGYDNLYAGHLNNNGIGLSFISVKLNNNEIRDLDVYNEYKKMSNISPDPCEDVITVGIFEDKKMGMADFFINDKFLYSGEDLKQIELDRQSAVEKIHNKQIERIHMKAYTLIASLMERIKKRTAELAIPEDNKNLQETINCIFSTFAGIADENFAKSTIERTFSQKTSIQTYAAKTISEYIKRTMGVFFK